MQSEDAVDDQQMIDLEPRCAACDTRVVGEVVLRMIDRVSLGEFPDMLDQQVGLQDIGMIEILPTSFLVAQMRKVAVIVIQMKMRPLELACQLLCQSGLSRTGTTCNTQ